MNRQLDKEEVETVVAEGKKPSVGYPLTVNMLIVATADSVKEYEALIVKPPGCWKVECLCDPLRSDISHHLVDSRVILRPELAAQRRLVIPELENWAIAHGRG